MSNPSSPVMSHSPSASHVIGFRQEQSSVSKEDLSFQSKMIGGYAIGPTLGSGSCAIVKLGTHCTTGKKVAIKIVKPTTLREQKEVIREVEALQMLRHHPHIIRLLRVIREDGYTCLIQELGSNGDLFERVLQSGRLPESQARLVLRQLLSAVQYCHAHLVVHRDLKPENILIDASGNVKISDFGLSNILRPGKLCSTFCGSPIYCPPEVVLQQQYSGTLVDVWSLGVILYVMVTGGMPWRLERNVVKNMDDLLAANYVIPDCLGISEECKSLIKTMLTAESTCRASMDMVASHPWVTQGFDGPPHAHLPPLPLVDKKDINDDVLQQLCTLGMNPFLAMHDIQTNPSSPALTTYHVLLEKHTRATKLANVSIADCAQPNEPAQLQPWRQRASSIPQNKQPLEHARTATTAGSHDQVQTREKSGSEGSGSPGILHNLFIYFEKFKKSRKTNHNNNRDSISIPRNSPTHSPATLRRRRV